MVVVYNAPSSYHIGTIGGCVAMSAFVLCD